MSTVSKDDLVASITADKIEPSSEELEDFRNIVSEWFKYDDQIRKLTIAIKERKNHQNFLNKKIQDFMCTYKYNDLNTQHGRIKSKSREVKVPIKITDIKDKIIQYKDLSGEELLNQIFNDNERPKVLKQSISRIIPKVSLTL
jgi:hypothetical protein